jgi:cyclin T
VRSGAPQQQRAHSQPPPPPPQQKQKQPQQKQESKPAVARLSPTQMVQNYRRATCAFMQDVGRKLRLPQLTISTAIVFFHRFFRMHNYEDYDRYLVSLTALFLAGKVEETPKKLQQIIEGTYPHIPKNKGRPPISVGSPDYQRLREDVLRCERVLLRTIGFDLTVDHPYQYLLHYVKCLNGSQKLAQTAWNFVNDSLRTTLCLQYPAQHIACAALYLACKYIKVSLPDGTKEGQKAWWITFDVNMTVLQGWWFLCGVLVLFVGLCMLYCVCVCVSPSVMRLCFLPPRLSPMIYIVWYLSISGGIYLPCAFYSSFGISLYRVVSSNRVVCLL